MFRSPRICLILIVLMTIGLDVALAQPHLINLGLIPSDLTSDGQTVVGLLYDRQIAEYGVVRYTLGGSIEEIPGAFPGGDGSLRCSDDASAVMLQADNIENWGDLNCYNGHPLYNPPLTEPCPIPAIAHHWTETTGWVNTGSFPRNEVVETYTCGSDELETNVFVGGTRCDFTVNTPYDISGDGRYIVGGGWLQNTDPWNNGCPPFGLCGDYFAWRWDSQTNIFEKLDTQPGTTTTRADRTNYDGNVIVGYDLGTSVDPDGPGPIEVYETRRLSVWRGGVQTLLDPYGHRPAAVTADGSMIASRTSEIQTEILFGPTSNPLDSIVYRRLVRWNWNGVDWVPENLGIPPLYNGFPAIQMNVSSISDDGNTIVGSVGYGVEDFAPVLNWRLFIWRPTINGGQITDFQGYLRSQMPMGDTTFDEDKMWIYDVRDLSADGNAMLVRYRVLDNFDDPETCLVTDRTAILYLNGSTCEPPTIELDATAIVSSEPTPLNSNVINCRATGSWPMSFQWQRKDFETGGWLDLVDDPDPQCSRSFGQYEIQGATTPQLRIGFDPQYNFPCDIGSGDYRCVVSNSCGSVTSDVAHVSISRDVAPNNCFTQLGDMNGDGVANIFDTPNFVSSLLCKPYPDFFFAADRADMNLDGKKDGLDIQEFVNAVVP